MLKIFAFLSAGFVGAFLVTALQASAEGDLYSQIMEQDQAFENYYNAGDAAGVAGIYAEDAILKPPGMQPITGRDAIAAFWGSAMAGGVAGVEFVTADVFGNGETATEVGKVIIFDADGGTIGTSSYIVVWKLVDGVWLLYRDLWNEDPPAETPVTE